MTEERPTYRAIARRDEHWWYVRLPALDLAVQARHRHEIERTARDVVYLLRQIGGSRFDLTVLGVESPREAIEAFASEQLTEDELIDTLARWPATPVVEADLQAARCAGVVDAQLHARITAALPSR